MNNLRHSFSSFILLQFCLLVKVPHIADAAYYFYLPFVSGAKLEGKAGTRSFFKKQYFSMISYSGIERGRVNYYELLKSEDRLMGQEFLAEMT